MVRTKRKWDAMQLGGQAPSPSGTAAPTPQGRPCTANLDVRKRPLQALLRQLVRHRVPTHIPMSGWTLQVQEMIREQLQGDASGALKEFLQDAGWTGTQFPIGGSVVRASGKAVPGPGAAFGVGS